MAIVNLQRTGAAIKALLDNLAIGVVNGENVADKVDTTDSRLSDARTPTAHTHATSEITGLDSALSSKLESVPNATSTTVGGFKARLAGTDLFITDNGDNP